MYVWDRDKDGVPDEHYAVPIIQSLAEHYGLRIIPEDEIDPVIEVDSGPGGSGIWWRGGAVVAGYVSDGAEILHELTHLILGRWSVSREMCEGWILLPVEWNLALWVMRRLPNDDRKRFLRDVLDYQYVTETQENFQYMKESWLRRSPAWRASERRAIEAGLLHPHSHEPTFYRPDRAQCRRLLHRGKKYEEHA